jgi:xylulokinase
MAAEAQGRPNPPYFLPFFSGAPAPFFDPDARGELKGLDLSTTPGQIVRGFFEGIAYMIRANLEIMEEISRPVRELRIFGGGSRSDVWCGIISDVVGRPVSALTISESAAVGAAILAGMGTGVYARPEDASEKIRVRTAYEPRGESVRRYGTEYAKVKALLDRRQRRR